MSFGQKFRLWTIAILLVCSGFVWRWLWQGGRSDRLLVAFLDVGQGDSVLIKAPNGNELLVDGGPGNKKILRALAAERPFYDRSIDLILATHPDADHIGGLADVLNRYKVEGFITGGNTSDTAAWRGLLDEIKKKKIPTVVARRGMRIDLGGGVYFDILFPDRDPLGWETNTSSIVGRLTYGDESFLLTGDSPKAIEEYLATLDGTRLKSNVLKPGHHGSRTSTAEIFLQTVQPQVAVISAGRDNRYGHPHQEVLDLLNKYRVATYRTDELGTVHFETDGQTLEAIVKGSP